MALPKLNSPTYQLELPSTGEKLKFRPFLIKEQKILMMAQESGEDVQLFQAMKGLVTACTFGKVDAENSPVFDIEYLFLQIRAKSVGETTTINIICPDDGKTQVPALINIDSIKVQKSEDHESDIKLDDTYTLRMKYPSLNEFIKSNFAGAVDDMNVDDTFDLIASCIEQVYSEEESWSSADCTKKELKDFLEQLDSKQFKMIEKFFETMPKLSHTVTVINPNTKKENKIVLEGLQNFFG